MIPQQLELQRAGQRHQLGFALDNVYKDLTCRREDEHIVEGATDVLPPLAVGFHPVLPNILALAEEEGGVIIYDTDKRQLDALKSDWLAHKNAIFDLDWVPGMNQLVTASGDHTVALWDVETEKRMRSFRGHSSTVKTVRYHEDNAFVFASGGRDGSIMIWDSRVNHRINAARMMPDSREYWEPVNTIRNGHVRPLPPQPRSGSRGRGAKTDAGTEVVHNSITSVVFREQHQVISACSVDGAVKVWDIRKTYTNSKSPVAWHTFPFPGPPNHTHGFVNLVLDWSKTRLFASCKDNIIYQFDCAAFQEKAVASYSGHEMGSFYIKLALSPCGKYLLSGSSDSMAYIWNTDHAKFNTRSTLNSSTNNNDIKGSVLKTSSGEMDTSTSVPAMLALQAHDGEVSDVAWCSAHDPLRVVTSGDDGMMRVWRVQGRDGGEECLHLGGKRNHRSGENGQQVIGRAEWTSECKHYLPPRKPRSQSQNGSCAPVPNGLRSPVKGATLPPTMVHPVSPAVKKSLESMPAGLKQSPSLLAWINSKTKASPKLSPLKSPLKSAFTSPRKLVITPKKTTPTNNTCRGGGDSKALMDSTSKRQNTETAASVRGVKRKLSEISSPSPHKLRKPFGRSGSARKSLFGGSDDEDVGDLKLGHQIPWDGGKHFRATKVDNRNPESPTKSPRKSPRKVRSTPTKKNLLLLSPRRSPRSKHLQSPTMNLPNLVFDPQPRTPVACPMAEKARTPDWLTKHRQKTEEKSSSLGSPKTPRSGHGSPKTPRRQVRRGGSISASPRTPRRSTPGKSSVSTPSSSRSAASKKSPHVSSPRITKTPQQKGKASILQYFSPQSGGKQ